jgi:hypothetical protein
VIDAHASCWAPWGAREAHGRDDQTSHAMLDNEIKEQRVLGTVLPAIFLGVAAFLLQRGGVAPGGHPARTDRRAQGPGLRQQHIAAHYLKLVLVIVLAGWCWACGWATGWALLFLGLYAEFFRFPRSSTASRPGCWWSAGADAGHRGGWARWAPSWRHGAPGAGRGHAPAGARALPPHAAGAPGPARAAARAAHDPAQHGAPALAHAAVGGRAWRRRWRS